MAAFRLLDLPVEIRIQIYTLAIDPIRIEFVRPYPGDADRPKSLSRLKKYKTKTTEDQLAALCKDEIADGALTNETITCVAPAVIN